MGLANDGARVLVVEPHAEGHHSTYLRWVVEGITERGWSAVVATTAEALAHPLLKGMTSLPRVDVRVVDMEFPASARQSRIGIIRHEILYWRAIRRIADGEISRGPFAAVVLPSLDYCFFACALLGVPYRGVPWHVISMRLSALEGAGSSGVPWKWRLARRLLAQRWLSTLFAISPSVQSVPHGWLTEDAAAKLRYLPDPAENRGIADRSTARARFGLTHSQLAILVFGSIDERKGLERLASALVADPALQPYVLIVAGMQSGRIAESLSQAPLAGLRDDARLIVLDRVLDDFEQAEVFAAADVVWLGYERHDYMSGVLVLAAQAGCPVIATHAGEIGALVREHGFGAQIEREGTHSAVLALLRLMDEAERRKLSLRALAAVENHTPANFKRSLITAMESA